VSISLRGKTVFITGASSGIGAATAKEFAKLGTRILQCARRLDKLQAGEDELRQLGAPEVFSFELDVQNRDDVEGTIATCLMDGARLMFW
jgi:3-hydroxy acid dehydrogenase/malonic semialdehyde reductase